MAGLFFCSQEQERSFDYKLTKSALKLASTLNCEDSQLMLHLFLKETAASYQS